MLIRTRQRVAPRPFAGFPVAEELFSSMLGCAGACGPSAALPALNIWETPEAFIVETELPGITPENLDISVVGSELTLKGQRSVETVKEGRYLRRERSAGSFQRQVTLPADVDAEAVQASLTNGVLSINLPKAKSARPKKIEIKPAQN